MQENLKRLRSIMKGRSGTQRDPDISKDVLARRAVKPIKNQTEANGAERHMKAARGSNLPNSQSKSRKLNIV